MNSDGLRAILSNIIYEIDGAVFVHEGCTGKTALTLNDLYDLDSHQRKVCISSASAVLHLAIKIISLRFQWQTLKTYFIGLFATLVLSLLTHRRYSSFVSMH